MKRLFLYSDGYYILISMNDLVCLLNLEAARCFHFEVYCENADGVQIIAQNVKSGTFMGRPEMDTCKIFLFEQIEGSLFLWTGTLNGTPLILIHPNNLSVLWTRCRLETDARRAFSPIYHEGTLFWIDTEGEVFSYNTATRRHCRYLLSEDAGFISEDENYVRWGPMANLVSILRRVYCIFVGGRRDVHIFYCLDGGLRRGLMVRINLENYDFFGGSVFLCRNQGALFVPNAELLDGVNLRDALWAGPVPDDCSAYSLEAHSWNRILNCVHSSCEGVWVFSDDEEYRELVEQDEQNFLELLVQDFEDIDVPNLVHGEQEEEHGADEEPEHDGEGGEEAIEGELYQMRSGQRSPDRKLQYIAELGRTIESLQNFGAEMAARVASYFQLRAALSMENRNLRHQIFSLKQEKLVKDGVDQALRNELERQKQISGCHRRSRSMASCSDMVGPSPLERGPRENSLALTWQMLELDMNKLSLGGSPVHVPLTRHSSARF